MKTLLLITTLLSINFTTILSKASMPQDQFIQRCSKSCRIVIEKSDITKSATDIIVNAANEQLMVGAGVCGAIFKTAGLKKLMAACEKFPAQNNVRCPAGEARITHSFDLKAVGIKYIIHAVGPDCRIIQNQDDQDLLLKNAYINSLKLAQDAGAKSITFPFISSGIYAFPKKRAAQIAIAAIDDFIKNNTLHTLQSIHFALFSQEDFELFCAVTQQTIFK